VRRFILLCQKVSRFETKLRAGTLAEVPVIAYAEKVRFNKGRWLRLKLICTYISHNGLFPC